MSKTVRDVIQEYATAMENRYSDKYLANRKTHLKRLNAAVGHRSFKMITSADVEALLIQWTAGKSLSSLNNHTATMKGLWRWAYTNRYTPVATIQTPRSTLLLPRQETMLTRWSWEEIREIRRKANPRTRLTLDVITHTALRVDDVLNIQREDYEPGVLNVYESKSKRVRALPVSRKLAETLVSAQWIAPADHLIPGFKHVPGSIAWTDDLSKPWSYPSALQGLEDAVEAAEVPRERGEAWHTLRRSVARLYFEQVSQGAGRDKALRLTMTFLGHANTLMTERYLGMQPDRDEHAAIMETWGE